MDKVQGECLARGHRPEIDCYWSRFTEMLLKAAIMQATVVVSRHSPTGRAVSLARDLGIAPVAARRMTADPAEPGQSRRIKTEEVIESGERTIANK